MPYDKGDDWARKLKIKTTGMFSTPSYFGVGEPYEDGYTSARPGATGLQMITNKQRSGVTGDNWNQNNGRRKDFIRLFEGEEQVDPGTYDRRWKVEQAKKNLTPDGFRYARAPQQSSGLGGTWGRIGPRLEYMPETEGKRDGREIRDRAAAKMSQRQMMCNPSKKGYGASTPGLMFGAGPRKGEPAKLGKEYEHSDDPFDGPRDAVKAERQHQMKMLEGRAPYRTMGASLDFFDAHKHTAAPKGLTEDPLIPPRPDPPKTEPISHIPFYPARAPREGGPNRGGYCFNKMPEYMEDPDDEQMKARKEEAEKVQKVGAHPFKPTGLKSSKPTRSITFHQAGTRA